MLNLKTLLCLILLVISSVLNSPAQRISRLEQKLLSATDWEKTVILVQLGYQHVNENPKISLEFGKEAFENAKNQKDTTGMAMALGLVGQSYFKSENYKQAINSFKEESKLIKHSGKPWIVNQFNIGLSSYRDGKERKAIAYYESGLSEAIKITDKEFILKNYEALFNLNFEKNRYKTALRYFKLYIAQRDEKFLSENEQQIDRMKNAYKAEIGELEEEKKAIADTLEVTQQELTMLQLEQKVKDLELQKEKLKQTRMLWVIVLLLIIAAIILVFYFQVRKSKKLISDEKMKSDKLLHNILPTKVVRELKKFGSSSPEKFSNVTVFFSDFVGFTEMSANINPNILIDELNDIFTRFDEIMEKHNCERIKTIGDAYLSVCGLPEANPNHVRNILSASLEITSWLSDRNKIADLKWEVRVGVHTGNLIGGIVGVKKYIYDVFGDTINTASRMESNSHVGRINVSEDTHRAAHNHFSFTARPETEIKGKGLMKMYFLDSAKN